MKHNIKLTIILVLMFVIAQLIGLSIIHAYNTSTTTQVFNETTQTFQNVTINNTLPYGYQTPDVAPQDAIFSIIIAIIIAVLLIFFLMKIKANIFLRIWFFVVASIAIAVSLNAFAILSNLTIPYASIIALVIAVPLAFFKVFKRNLIVHNVTELVIYPGIAAILVPIFNIWTIIILLILISAYDIWAVWHSGFMQKMAKYQMNEVKVFGGFFIPYMRAKDKALLEKMKNKKGKGRRIKVSLAILGGGDVAYPLIATGVVLLAKGFLPAVIVVACAGLSLFLLMMFSKRGKYYPAMPFLTSGIFIGMALAYLFF